jgi:spore maturation protein CgeB
MTNVILNFRKGFPPLREAFEAIGCRVLDNAWQPDPGQLANTAACFLNLYEAVRAPLRAYALKQRLKKAGVPLVCLDRDAPWHMGIRRRRLRFFAWLGVPDIYATHTLQPTWQFAPAKLYNANAVWVRNFNLHGRTLEEMRNPAFFRHDVSFVGNMDGVRYKEHADRQRFFAALEERLQPLGLRILFRHSSGMTEADQIEVIQRSVINLNYRSSCDHGGALSWGLPERCYGVPARGGFMLSDHRQHAADDFDLQTEWAEFADMDDCVGKIRHYLDHFPLTRHIAEAAHARVMRDHTYESRAAALLRAADEWRRNRSGSR